MTTGNLEALAARLAPGQRLLGIDPGTKTLGLALSDVGRRIASPYGSLSRTKLAPLAAALREVARREGAHGLVIGFPVSMDGSIGPAAQGVRDWAFALCSAADLPMALWDERLSSAAVNRFLIGEADMTRSRRAQVVDKLAATWMLQGALDALNR